MKTKVNFTNVLKIITISLLCISTSCNYLGDKFIDSVLGEPKDSEGFVMSEYEVEEREKLVGNLKPRVIQAYPDTFNTLLKNFLIKNYDHFIENYQFTIYHGVATTSDETEEDEAESKAYAYLDTNHYMVQMKDTVHQKSKALNLMYDLHFNLLINY